MQRFLSLAVRLCWPSFSPMSSSSNNLPVGVREITIGQEGDACSNEVLFVAAEKPQRATETVIYFGGDVQDWDFRMTSHRDNIRHVSWSLEQMAKLLVKAYNGQRNVMIVRPTRMELQTFSCYENFMPFKLGNPEHDFEGQGKAMDHLRALILSLQSQLDSADGDSKGLVDVVNGKKTLIGFSKGVVVLNQLVLDMAATDTASELNIAKMCWMDGGHNGGKHTWLTSTSALEKFCQLKIAVDVRVTPYQIHDSRRPWIKQEEKRFTGILRRSGASIQRKMYFEDEEPRLENHFKVLNSLLEIPP